MSDTKLPMNQRNEDRENLSPRGHPQQHQGHKPNQEQVGGGEDRLRKPANDVGSNGSQPQQHEVSKGLYEKPNKDHLTLVKKAGSRD
ncbi:hypothetical protein ABIC71_004139 [Herbaspirillum seropedicae]|jgi:hypothetical protein|uniref:hypothetical protein n=1 Tax=Herbaspirillum seropedicae TaxID=964 RepID=UPI00339947E2